MKLICALVTFAVIASASAASPWMLTTADFAQQEGEIISAGPEAVEIRTSAVKQVPWREIVSLSQSAAVPVQARQPFMLVTRDGQSLAGKPAKIADEKLHWESESLGSIQVALEGVRGVARPDTAFPSSSNEDVATLQNGDIVRGVVDAADSEGITIQKGADKTAVRWDSIQSLLLAEVGNAGAASPGTKLRVHLTDGSACLATQLRMDDGQVQLARGEGEALRIPLTAVISIENLAGRARFLSEMRPSEQRYAPYLPSASPPQGMRLVAGKVIELKPESTISYIAPADGKVHLRYACADPGQLTDMSLEIRVDQKTSLKQEGIRQAAPSAPIDVAVLKGQAISMTVGYGKNFDVEDTLRLLEAAFIEKP